MIAHITHVAGVDPGLVHTGLVDLMFVHEARELSVQSAAVLGTDASKVRDQLAVWGCYAGPFKADIWIEGYRPRSNLNSDTKMVKAVADIKAATRGRVLDNTGVKKVVKQPLMELLGVWKFATPTHHQDLRSAARIAILGMLKDPDQNRLIADIVKAHLAGTPWTITTT